MNSANFSQTIIREAVTQAVTQLAQGLEQKTASIPTATRAPIDGLVADATGSEITINVGTQAGVSVGEKLLVTRVTKVIKDPVTGKALRSVQDSVGQLTITSADANSAVGTFSGTGQPQVGDVVKSPPTQ
jgi:hypothetical protein